MASKILMGDMPELMDRILMNLETEIDSLHSCALVNRHWCKMSIPILWQDPFSFTKNQAIISEYFSSLDENGKLILKEFGIIPDFPNTLFNYARFLKVLDLSLFGCRVDRWINFQLSNMEKNATNKLKYDITNLLLKILIKSGATLSTLILNDSKLFKVNSEISYLLERNTHFFSQLQDLFVEEYNVENVIMLLNILSSNATNLYELKFKTFNINDTQLLHAFISIIKSQQHLEWFKFHGNENIIPEFNEEVISALENQNKALKGIQIAFCEFNTEFEALRKFENLEAISIVGSDEQKILKLLNPDLCKLSTLEICSYESIEAANIIQILEKSGPLLQQLKLDSDENEIYSQSLLFETLINFCQNITYLYISSFKLSDQFLNLINCLQKLQFLSLCWLGGESNESKEMMKTYIKNFAEILPSTLQYLDLSNIWESSHIDILLDHCDAPLENLLMTIIDYDSDFIDALIRFCERK
ncbi:hypothetical protein F8M41_005636 [Gigaspora margarita]|uniref:F-box domain-containing protein n=1 Tax=Gigaspora margarita TaxID=4874 RepID=A0A8H4A4T6_GIGMA|nr:hypothetical protein F8M41_005636 [Gigaspora margarita]